MLTACAASPPRANPWADKAITAEPAARPVALPAWSDAVPCGEALCLTPAQADALLTYSDVADANYEIAVELAGAVDELGVAYNSLVKAGTAEYELSELRGEMVEAERKGRLWDKMSYWALLGLLGAGAVAK